MTTLLRAASELGLTRIDIPFLLGTAVSVDRTRAKVVGFALHFAAGVLFALLYYASFVAINRSGWWIGAGFGVFHALFAGTTLVNILLPFAAAVRSSSHGDADGGSRLDSAPGTTWVHAIELWSQYAGRESCRSRGVRGPGRRIYRAVSGLTQ